MTVTVTAQKFAHDDENLSMAELPKTGTLRLSLILKLGMFSPSFVLPVSYDCHTSF
jgi:hypothetical protein